MLNSLYGERSPPTTAAADLGVRTSRFGNFSKAKPSSLLVHRQTYRFPNVLVAYWIGLGKKGQGWFSLDAHNALSFYEALKCMPSS